MPISSKPLTKLSSDLSKLVASELKLVALAIDSNRSISGLADQIHKSQINLQKISESWSLALKVIPNANLNIAELNSIAKSFESTRSVSQMKLITSRLELNKAAFNILNASKTLEKLVLASAYSPASFSKSIVDIVNSSRPVGWKNTKMSLSFATELGLKESITSVHVLNPRILNRLVASKSRSARRKVLYDNRTGIVNHCMKVVELANNDLLDYYFESINSFKRKDFAASQSLSASLIDTSVQKFTFSKTFDKRTKQAEKFISESENLADLSIENFVILYVLAGAYSSWSPNKGEPIPKYFNRNATAHSVHKIQYNEINALEGIMLCGSVMVAESSNVLPFSKSS
jgi:hypothetical protein